MEDPGPCDEVASAFGEKENDSDKADGHKKGGWGGCTRHGESGGRSEESGATLCLIWRKASRLQEAPVTDL